MNPDYDESVITSSEGDHVHSEENHICTEGHVCTVPHDHEEELVISESEPFVEPPKQTEPPVRKKHLGWFVLGGVMLVCVGVTGFVYSRPVSDPAVKSITNIVPFPALMVGRSFVTIHDYQTEKEALLTYFKTLPKESQDSAPQGAQLDQMISDALVNKAVVKKIASDLGVRLDPVMVESAFQDMVKAQGTEQDFEKQLQTSFGWSTKQFKKSIVESMVLSKQLEAYIAKSPLYQEPQKQKIDAAFDRVKKGEDFAAVADDVHTKAQVTMKSDLGFIKLSEIPAEWSDKVKDLKKDEVSPVIDLDGGYAIFKLVDKANVKNDVNMHLFVITIPKMTLEQVIKQYLGKVHVKQFIS